MSVREEMEELRAKERRKADRERWRQYACAALAVYANIASGESRAAAVANTMLRLERERFGDES